MNKTLLSKIGKKISHSKRIVIKIGTNVLMKNGMPNVNLIKKISDQIAVLMHANKEVILVSSGSIGFGAVHLDLKLPIKDIPLRQACASVGQPYLMTSYSKAFKKHNIPCAQLLLTRKTFQNSLSKTKLDDCLSALIKKKSLAIINENDCVTTEEVDEFFGDNDQLSAMVSKYFNADVLIILTDIDALYDKNPHDCSDAQKIKLVTSISNELKQLTKKTGSSLGTGGMYTKLKAAETAQEANCIMVIAYAQKKDILLSIAQGDTSEGTFFVPKAYK